MYSSVFLRAILITAFAAALPCPAPAQDPLKSLPNNYKLVLDNPDLDVIRVHYGPHEKVPVHDHSNFPTIYVYLNDSGEVRLTHDETPPLVITRPPTKTGSFRIAPARPERHSIENLGDQPSDFLRVELKKLPLTDVAKPVRGAAPEVLKPGTTEEFHNSELTIRRIVCEPSTPCNETTSPNTLLIDITPVAIHADDPLKAIHNNLMRQLQTGDVAWQSGARQLRLQPTTQAAAQLLEIQLSQ